MTRLLRAVTLDLYGTLLDFDVERDETPMVADLLDETGSQLDPSHVLACWVREALDDRAKQPFRSVRSCLEAGAAATRRRLGLNIDPVAWADALEHLWMTREPFPGTLEAMDRLRDAGLRLAIVTNLDTHVLSNVVERTGLGGMVDAAVSSERARAYKPHPRPFQLALDALDAGPADAIHVGDSPGEDRAGAHAAGMQCVLVDEQGLSSRVDDVLSFAP